MKNMTEMAQNPGQFATNVPNGFGTNMPVGMGMPVNNPYMTNMNAPNMIPPNGMMQPGYPNQFSGNNFGTNMGMGMNPGTFGTNMGGFTQPLNQPS